MILGYRSHPTTLLKDHLTSVAISMKTRVSQTFFNNFPIEKAILEDIAYIIGIFHDFGKSTTYFQKYLLNQILSEKTHHSCVSAFIAAEFIFNYFQFVPLDRVKNANMLVLVAFECIRHHHTDLLSFELEIDDEESTNFKEWKVVPEQCKDILKQLTTNEELFQIYEEALQTLSVHLGDKGFSLRGSFKEFLTHFSSYENILNFVKKTLRPIYSRFEVSLQEVIKKNDADDQLMFFVLMQFYFSLLIDSDKKMAADVVMETRKELNYDLVDKYREKKFQVRKEESKGFQELNKLRNLFYKEVCDFPLKAINSGDKLIYSITAPTGIGKTLAVFSFALRMRALIKSQLNYTPQILYFLPFTSIIDQNYLVLVDLLKETIKDFPDNEEMYLLKHHHLSELKYRQAKEEIPNDEALLLIESWESEIIVSTFAQMFNTIFGYENSQLKKYNKFVNSIVILDEIQSFPPEYWIPFRACVLFFAKYFNTKIILLTATQPAIFDNKEIIEVLKDPKIYFESPLLNRIEFKHDLSKRFIDDALAQYKETQNNFKSYIFVANTIQSSIDIFNFISGSFSNLLPIAEINIEDESALQKINDEYILIYLSSYIIPKIRADRIKFIKNLTQLEKKFIVITTQLIEAGVDIDANKVVRDFGPLDSLIQVSGRCNRNNQIDKGHVEIYRYIGDRNYEFSRYIYSESFLNATEMVLRNIYGSIKENAFPTLSKTYFNLIKKDFLYTQKYLKILLLLKYGTRNIPKSRDKITSLRDFSIIKDELQTTNVYIDINEESAKIHKQFAELIEEIRQCSDKTEYFRLKSKLKQIKRKLHQYTISIQSNRIKSIPNLSNNYSLIYIPLENLKDYYDKMTGFKFK